jgi:hypothetical protein
MTVPSDKDYDVELLNAAGTVVASSAAGTGASESMTATLTAGTRYYIKVYGYSGAYSTTSSYSFSFSLTTIVSSLSISSPTNGATLTGTQTFAASVTNPPASMTKAVFYWNGQFITFATAPSWSTTFDTFYASAGSGTLTVKGEDSNGKHLHFWANLSLRVKQFPDE